MSVAVVLDALDLAALLCSRVCHDLISPAGAIVNGLEVLEEKDSDEETKTFALDLIKRSARTASARLQFCRLAFGAAGSANAQIDLGNAQAMARGFIEDDKTKLTWNLPHALLPKNRVKLLLNMLIIAGQTIPRGGTLTVDPVGEGETMGFRISASGLNARVPHAVPALLGAFPRTDRSTRTRSSRSMPACWRALAGSRSTSPPRATPSSSRPPDSAATRLNCFR
jgi:histidine phosphotransferase ChpT